MFQFNIQIVEDISKCWQQLQTELPLEMNQNQRFCLRIALYELASNVLLHGNSVANVTCAKEEQELILCVFGDNCFVPNIQLSDCKCSGGRGMYLVKKMCGNLTYRNMGHCAQVSFHLGDERNL